MDRSSRPASEAEPAGGQERGVLSSDRDERVGEAGSSGESLTIGDTTYSPIVEQTSVELFLPIRPVDQREIATTSRQVSPQDSVSGQYSGPLASGSTYSSSTGASSDSSLGPDASDTGELGLPPEASDPGIVGPAPETTGPDGMGLAPEAGELAIEFGAPHSSAQDMSGLPPEAPDPGAMGPAPEASDLGN